MKCVTCGQLVPDSDPVAKLRAGMENWTGDAKKLVRDALAHLEGVASCYNHVPMVNVFYVAENRHVNVPVRLTTMHNGVVTVQIKEPWYETGR